MEDFQFHLMAVKNGVVYPVMLTEEQNQMLQLYTHAIGKIHVLNEPQGVAKNLSIGVKK
jgi:hypothetical protein